MTFETEIELSTCDYDADVFTECVLNAKEKNWNWNLYNNCRDFVLTVVAECKKGAKRSEQGE